MKLLVVLILFCGAVGAVLVVPQPKWLPYARLVQKHGANYYWGLDVLQGLDVYEQYSGQPSLSVYTTTAYNMIMCYECESSNVLNFTTNKSRVDAVLPSSYTLLPAPSQGFTIDGFIMRKADADDATVLSSWGTPSDSSQSWRLFWINGQLSFQWFEGNTSSLRICRVSVTWDTSDWMHFAVRYSPYPVTTGQPNIVFFLNGVIQSNDPSGDVYCGSIGNIGSGNSSASLPVTIGATYSNGSSNPPTEGYIGLMAKLALYPKAISDALILSHASRLSLTTGPCHGNGLCDPTDSLLRCICYPIWFGENCTQQFNISSVSPNVGSYYGSTTITIVGSGLLELNPSGLNVRLGPTLMPLDQWAGATSNYSQCIITTKGDSQIVCTTTALIANSPQNVSVVTTDPNGYPANRLVFSLCVPNGPTTYCLFYPELTMTPRVWSYNQWAVSGSTLTFEGQYFLYNGFQLLIGASHYCQLNTQLVHNSTQFSCTVPTDITPGYYTMKLIMSPNGASSPLSSTLYVHPNNITIFPLYPLQPNNIHCPTSGQIVQILPASVPGSLNASQIRIYEAPCYRRLTSDYLWLLNKVPLDYWQTFGYDMCPPYLHSYSNPLYIPSAFTMYNTFQSQPPASQVRKERRFVDSQGNNHCVFMEVDIDSQ